ncbi:MAG: AEC family transporter [Oscillospiraceae bacterium]|nr:AEC family transporter [Oscillospiraceae bacterium]
MQATINQLAVLFILLALGYIGCKVKALTPETGKVLTKLVFTITLPLTILSSVIDGSLNIEGGETVRFMLLTLAVNVIYVIIAIPISRILCKDKSLRGMYAFMLIFGNVAFMGLPLASAIFGQDAVFYIALFGIPFWISSLSFGVVLVSGKKERFNPKSLLNPVFIASLLAIPLALIDFRMPDVIIHSVRLAGSITTPASMLIIGVILAQSPLKDVFSQWRLLPMTMVKLVVIPVIVWLVLRPFIDNELILGVIVVLSGMPTAAVAAMFAIEFGNNEKAASGGVFLTTLLSGITIPLIVYFLLG